MWCMKCQNEFPSMCSCKDRDDRLETLSDGNWAFMTCIVCAKHADLCTCDEPEPQRALVGNRHKVRRDS